RVNMRLHRPMKQLVQLSSLGFRQAMTQWFKFSPVFFCDVDLASNQRRNERCKDRSCFSPLMSEISFNQRAQASDHHLVADTEHDGSIISMGFNVRPKTRSAEVSRQQRVIHSLGSIREFFARR